MLVFDFFAGTGSSTRAFADAGHTVITIEMDTRFEVTKHRDMMTVTAAELLDWYGKPDFVWASPPCTAFSVASIGHHWSIVDGVPTPKTPHAQASMELVAHTLRIIDKLNPTFGWLMENPRGMLRKLPVVADRQRRTITYCKYGDTRMKPTDLWGDVLGWEPRPPCKNGDTCHEPAPRGSQAGTQGLKNATIKSMIPYELGQELLTTIEGTQQ